MRLPLFLIQKKSIDESSQTHFFNLVKFTNLLFYKNIFLCNVGKNIKLNFFHFLTKIFWPDL